MKFSGFALQCLDRVRSGDVISAPERTPEVGYFVTVRDREGLHTALGFRRARTARAFAEEAQRRAAPTAAGASR